MSYTVNFVGTVKGLIVGLALITNQLHIYS